MLQIKHRAGRAWTRTLTGNTLATCWTRRGKLWHRAGEGRGVGRPLIWTHGEHGAAVQHDGRQLRGLHR